MALQQKTRLRDVPKGKRLQHFFTYYKLHLFYVIVFGALIGYTLYSALQPDPDIWVAWLTDDYSVYCEGELTDNLEKLDWDINGDGRVSVTVTQYDFSTAYEDMTYSDKSIVSTVMNGQMEYSFYLVNDYALDWLRESEALGTYADAGITGENEDEYLIIPVSQIPQLLGNYSEPLEDLYLCISDPPLNDEDDLAEYELQMAALRKLLRNAGLLSAD